MTSFPTTSQTGIASHGPGRTSSQRQEYQLTQATSFSALRLFLAMRHALGMEPPINPDQPSDHDSGSNRPAQWHSDKCTRHPIISGSATAGMARKTGHLQVV